MKFLQKLACSIVAFSMTTVSAHACAGLISIEQRIASGYEQGIYTSVLLAKVTDAKPAGRKGWQGSALAMGDLTDIPYHPDLDDGQFPEKNNVFSISRSGEGIACDDGVKIPKKDDIWIMYMRNDKVIRSYPMITAYNNDPKLQTEWIIRKKDGTTVVPDKKN